MTKKNDSFEEIGEVLRQAGNVLLFPHVNIDGDAMGSCVALCRVLRQLGKEAWVLLEEEAPEYLCFLDDGYTRIQSSPWEHADVCIALDCSERSRLETRSEVYQAGKRRLCVDHHAVGGDFEAMAELQYIDKNSASCAELIFQLIRVMGAPIDGLTAEALYTGIMTDTGNFQYNNVRQSTHRIVADLFDCGLNHQRAVVEVYQSVRQEKLRLSARALAGMELFAEGKAIIASVSQKDLLETDAKMSETEGIVETLRSIRGVEMAALLKEHEGGKVKVTMRAKSTGNVAKIATVYDGGGHIRAAGCTLNGGLEQARKTIREAMEQQLKDPEVGKEGGNAR